jgi:anti-sigma factor RsiW
VSSDLEVKQEEGASQLSAMFDGELSSAECELLSRRLGRDEQLRGRWARYSLIGAALRSEPVAAVSQGFARKVGAVLDASSGAGAMHVPSSGIGPRLRRLALGGAMVAGVAAAGIFVLRGQMLPGEPALTAYIPMAQRVEMPPMPALTSENLLARVEAHEAARSREPISYVVPPVDSGSGSALPAALANYVVAHSEYSSPLARGGLISSLVAGDSMAPVPLTEADGEVILSGLGSDVETR